MAERDKTITIPSHLHFASSVNILGSCCYVATIPCTHQCKKAGAEHVLVIETVTEITHERHSRMNAGTVLYYLLDKRR